MQNFDRSTEFGARADQRLRDDLIGWLTTLGLDGTPQPSPIWFFWDGTEILIFSEPHTPKVRNIQRQPKVSLHLNGDEHGNNIVILTGEARIDEAAPEADTAAAYTQKYQAGMESIGLTADEFAKTYSVAIRFSPAKLRGH
ncbi:MAG: TIGR03667 family PPOX class F420-dependent oxidoreductase [Chloroflexota bacterium]|nr:TIGR03667 family PPOX class F420-dependent oxidoreductase [Chloroflexota bacterium]